MICSPTLIQPSVREHDSLKFRDVGLGRDSLCDLAPCSRGSRHLLKSEKIGGHWRR